MLINVVQKQKKWYVSSGKPETKDKSETLSQLYKKRFTVRANGEVWDTVNIERANCLIFSGRTPSFLDTQFYKVES